LINNLGIILGIMKKYTLKIPYLKDTVESDNTSKNPENVEIKDSIINRKKKSDSVEKL